MKILILSPYPILPPLHGSRVRTARLAEGLARAGATVTLLCPWYPGQPRNARVADAFVCRSHFLLSNVLPLALSRVAAPLALLSFQPPPRRRLRVFAGYDVFQFEFCAQAEWMKAVPDGARIVYSAHNVERDFCDSDRARYLLSRASLARIERLERLAVQRSELVVTCTEDDAVRLGALYGPLERSVVVPNGCPAALLQLSRQHLGAAYRAELGFGPQDRLILFVGGDASHNQDSVRFLLREVVPTLDRNACLLVVGRCSSSWRNAMGRVRFLGFVDDLSPCLAAADVAVNPVERGSGSSVKLVEYLAAGLPVISTPAGIRGFAQAPAGVRVVPRNEFPRALRGRLDGLAPDRAALDQLTWEHLGRRLLRAYEAVCG